MKRSAAIIFATVLIGLFTLIAVGCDNQDVPIVGKPVVERPVVVGILYDQSGSYANRPPIDSVSIFRVISAIGDRGGVLAAGCITEESYVPLLTARLQLDTLPLTGNLKERAQIHQANLARLHEYEVTRQRFFQQIWTKLNAPRTAKMSDIAGGVSRFTVLFNQESFENYDRLLCLITDGMNNSGKGFDHLPDAEYFSVGWPCDSAAVILKHPVSEWESFELLVDYLVTTRLRQDGCQAGEGNYGSL